MSTPPPAAPTTPARRFGLTRRTLLLVAAAFAAGLLLFLLLLAGRDENEPFFRAGAQDDARGGAFEPLPTPDAEGATGEALPQALPGDAGNSVSGTGDTASGAIEPPELTEPLPPPPAEVAPPAPPIAGGADTSPRPVRSPQPQYPAQALRRRESGTVLVQVHVDARGRPERVEVVQSSRSRELDREAVRTVERWEFAPATRGGQPVPAKVLVPIDFRP